MDPVEAATSYLDIDGNDELLNEAKETAERMLTALREPELANSFRQSERYQNLQK